MIPDFVDIPLVLELLRLQLVFFLVFSCFIINFPCSVTLFWSWGSIYSTLRYSYSSVLPDNYNADIFIASLLISSCSFLSLILSSIAMIIFYIIFRRFSPNRKGLSDAKVSLIIKKEYEENCNILFCKDS